jgi:putative DNA primase/helicase
MQVSQFEQTIENRSDCHDDAIENSSRGTPTEDCTRSFSQGSERPDLIVDDGDLPSTAREVRDALAGSGFIFDRGMPVKLVKSAEGGPPRAVPLTAHQIIIEAHQVRRPVKLADEDELIPVTLPMSVARMYLAMQGDWNLPPLAGICTAPLLKADGSVRAADGYDRDTGLWCASVPDLQIPERPTRADAEAALRLLREPFRSFPFADAVRRLDPRLGTDVVNLDHPPGLDESTWLAGLMTAVCRPSLWLAPALAIRAPEISGSGTGKGLLVRAISAIAFGIRPSAFTRGGDCQEFDKRLASIMVEAAPVVFLDNVNGFTLHSEALDSVLTERPSRVRILHSSQTVMLHSAAFIAVTGNGLAISRDLARRFLICEFDAGCEDPEQRPFESGFLGKIEGCRGELLSAALTIWRFGRQHAARIERGRPLGSFEDWTEWCRDPLLALGCRDPIERIDRIKADDPNRRQTVELFEAWNAHHDERPIKAADLAVPVRALVDPQGRGRQHIAARLTQLSGTRAGGFVLTRQEAAGKWGASTYALRRTGSPVAKA